MGKSAGLRAVAEAAPTIESGTVVEFPGTGSPEYCSLEKAGDQPAGVRHVFVSERGAPFTTNGFFKTLSRAAASIGMADVHPHLLRHGTGFKLVNQGVDTRTLAAYLGHRNLANTARYTKMDARRFDGFWQD